VLAGSLAFLAAALRSDWEHSRVALAALAASYPVFRLVRRASIVRGSP